MGMDRGKYTGWSLNGKIFTRKQYNNSWLKRNTRRSYEAYLKWHTKYIAKKRKKRRSTGGFGMPVIRLRF